MADIAPGLNFRISADVKGINKAIREAEKSLRGAVSSFSSIGNSLSLALTAPIAAFTGISLKAAGEMESLRLALEKTMGGAGRSIDEAKMELEELRKAALAPGLDFQQAVKGSIRLQGVGYQAEQARKIIVELANALTLAGGTADQLDGVTKQFTQMIGKGKIMQEDLTIILENMPNLAKVMQDTFGTSNAEMLRKMGVSVEDFISKLTDGMAKLPRAQGGIANEIVNAQNAIKLAIAEVGEEINKVFNVTGKLQAFSEWIAKTAKWFRELDDSTKRAIGAVVVFLATLGPAFKVMQAGVFIVGKLQIAFLMLQKALVMSVSPQGIPGVVAAWKKLDLAMKASLIGAAVGIVLALGAAWYATSKDMSAAAHAAKQLEDTRSAAASSIAIERAEIAALVSVAGNENESKKDRLNAMNRLIEISPEYRKALDGENIDTQKLKGTTDELVKSLLAAATARRAAEDIARLRGEVANLEETAKPTIWQNIENGAEGVVDALGRYGNLTGWAKQAIDWANGVENAFNPLAEAQKRYNDQYKNNYQEQKAIKEAQIKELEELLKAQVKVYEFGKKTADGGGGGGGLGGAAKEVKEAVKAFEAFAQLPTLAMPSAVTSGAADPFGKALEGLKGITGGMNEYRTAGQQMGQINKMIVEGVDGVGNAFTRLGETLIAHGQIFAGIAATTVGAMQGLADSGEGIESMGKAVVGSLKKIVGGLIKTGVTAVVTKALLSSALNPFAALALGAATGALAQALFNSIINKIKVPALAEGGVLTSPQMVMAGEYAGARRNPEIISPENKMRDVFGEVMQKYGGGAGGTLVARVSGDDLLFVLEKAERKAKRLR